MGFVFLPSTAVLLLLNPNMLDFWPYDKVLTAFKAAIHQDCMNIHMYINANINADTNIRKTECKYKLHEYNYEYKQHTI